MGIEAFESELIESTLPIKYETASSDLFPIPKWLNELFLAKHLRSSFPDKKISIRCFEVKPATATGDNYNSVIYRVNVKFMDGSSAVSLLIK